MSKSRGGHRKRVREKRPRVVPGAAPGSLRPAVEGALSRLRAVAYGPDGVVEPNVSGWDDIAPLRSAHPVTWIQVEGLGATDLLAHLGDRFGVHRLALEDVLNTHQRPKSEAYEGHVFCVAQIVTGEGDHETEQVSIIFGADYVLTFVERVDPFEPVRDRIRKGGGRLRTHGSDYLAYALLDLLVDSYFPVLESAGDRLDALEDRVLEDPGAVPISELQHVKRELIALRRAVWPLRELLSGLLREESGLVQERTRLYLRDCQDHAMQLMDLVESYRDVAGGLTDLYLSSVSNRMNEVMKVLTIIATIFIPLGFIAGLYGMNFDSSASPWNMPETRWYWGYPMALLLMVAVSGVMLWFFRSKGWILGPRSGPGPE